MKKKTPQDNKKNTPKKSSKITASEVRNASLTKSETKSKTEDKPSALKTENIKKAAKMILAVGEENAIEILKHLDSDSVEKVVAEMIKMKSLKDDEKVLILRDFKKNLDRLGTGDYGGISQAEKFLEKTLGRERAEKHIHQVRKNIDKVDYTEIENFPPENAALVLGGELAQTTAFILATISSSYAAKVLSHLNSDYRVSVARKIAAMNRVMPEIVRAAYETIIKKLKGMDRTDLNVVEGENRLIEILNHMDRSLEDKILENLEADDPEMSLRIRDKLRVFEDILQLTTRELRKVFDLVPDHKIWANALKGAGQNIIKHIFSSISMNRASDIMTEMKYIDKVPLKEIEQNRRIIMDVIDKLEKEGTVMLRKNKEEMVE
ncbi:MAG: hypothetical protein OEV78_03240 [Spirochaetia bacterium]|nr:hypothetical protein [Spirochaetia bacterium]